MEAKYKQSQDQNYQQNSSKVNNMNFIHFHNNCKAYYVDPKVSIKQDFNAAQLQYKDITQKLLSSDDNKLWVSPDGCSLPHSVLIDFTQIADRPSCYRYIGFYCWHSYNSNPQQVRVSISIDGRNFINWQTFQCQLMAGPQIFRFKNKIDASNLKFMKIDILSNFAASEDSSDSLTNNRVYLNQLLLFENYVDTHYQSSLSLQQQQNGMGFYTTSQATSNDMLSQIMGTSNVQQNMDQNLIHQLNRPILDFSGQIKTIETQFDLENPISYQPSVDESISPINQFSSQPYERNPDAHVSFEQQRLSVMIQQLDSLQQQSFDQFNMIKKMKTMLSQSQQPLQSPKMEFLEFFNNLYQAYLKIQNEMLILQDNIQSLNQQIQERQYQDKSQVTNMNNNSYQPIMVQDQEQQLFAPQLQQFQSVDFKQSDNNNNNNIHTFLQTPEIQVPTSTRVLQGTQTFRNRESQRENDQFVNQCLDHCKVYILDQFQHLNMNKQQHSTHIDSKVVANKENQSQKKSQRQETRRQVELNTTRFEKSLERRIDKFISSQVKHRHQALQEMSVNKLHNRLQNVEIYQATDSDKSSCLISHRNPQKLRQESDVSKLADQLQQKLAAKAKKLQELQEKENLNMNGATPRQHAKYNDQIDASEGDQEGLLSDNSSIISNCSSLIKFDKIRRQKEVNARNQNTRHQANQRSRVNNKLEIYKRFEADDDDADTIVTQSDSKLEQYFIASNRDNLIEDD